AAEAALRQVIGERKIDEALTIGKYEIQEETKKLLQLLLDSYKSRAFYAGKFAESSNYSLFVGGNYENSTGKIESNY
ncbi:unnamed protein product, partial [marine sediment metagenome]